MTWRIGLATGCCAHHHILDVLDAADAAGFTGIEIGTPPGHFAPGADADVDAVARRLEGLRCVPVSMHAPFGGAFDLAHDDARHRAGIVESHLSAARVLKRLGGTILIVHPTDHVRADHDISRRRLDDAAEALRQLTGAAGDLGITIAIETPLPHLIGGHPEEFERILHHVGYGARVCLDTGHTFLGGFTQRFIELAGDRLAHVHAHDNHGRYDDHLTPGDGAIDWATVRESLNAVRYQGWLVLELKCPGESMADSFRRARHRLEELVTPIPYRIE